MMQVDYLILADAVAVAEGKHYIHGAGWDTLYATSFPAVHPVLGVAARLRIFWEEMNQPHTLEVDVLNDEHGNSVLPDPPGVLRNTFNIQRPPDIASGPDRVVPLALTFTNLHFQTPGTHTIVLRVDKRDLKSLRFHVALPPVPSQ